VGKRNFLYKFTLAYRRLMLIPASCRVASRTAPDIMGTAYDKGVVKLNKL
jgi:hypothetical protein